MSGSCPASAAVYAIYRRRNAVCLDALLAPARTRGWPCRLWALDEIAAELAEETIGVGPGLKFGLLRELLRLAPPSPDQAVVVADDDVVVPAPDGLARMLLELDMVGADLGQPAHAWKSRWSHRFTRCRPWARVRVTNFVEIGPLFVVMPSGHQLVLDRLPEDMGWGHELTWWALWRAGQLRMAIVDAVRMKHTAAPGLDYGLEEVRRGADTLLEQAGFGSWQKLQRTSRTVPRWRLGEARGTV